MQIHKGILSQISSKIISSISFPFYLLCWNLSTYFFFLIGFFKNLTVLGFLGLHFFLFFSLLLYSTFLSPCFFISQSPIHFPLIHRLFHFIFPTSSSIVPINRTPHITITLKPNSFNLSKAASTSYFLILTLHLFCWNQSWTFLSCIVPFSLLSCPFFILIDHWSFNLCPFSHYLFFVLSRNVLSHIQSLSLPLYHSFIYIFHHKQANQTYF